MEGVVHAAGVTADAFLVRQTLAAARRVLAPKTTGVAVLDEATAADPLRWFAGFSSVAAVDGNVGQVDYAYANAFVDAFLRRRARRVLAGERAGRSVAIQWPLWDTGLGVAPELLALRGERVEPLPATLGCAVLERW